MPFNPSSSSLTVSALMERLRESIASVCVAGLVLGVGLGAILGRIEGPALIEAEVAQQFTLTITVLSAVMTVVGVVLSIMTVAQQLASQQYSPRAIRTELRDRRTRTALGSLFGYIGFMMGVVEGIDQEMDNPLGVAVGLLLSVAAIGVVAYLIQHVTDGFRAGELVARIGDDTLAAVRRIAEHDEEHGAHRGDRPSLDVPDDAFVVPATRSGYLQDADVHNLSLGLAERGVHLRLGVGLGDFVGAGTGLGWAWPDALDRHDTAEMVTRHLRFGDGRTTQREVGSGIQQLVDIALKALSPAINDPYTAVESINTITDVLQQMAERRQDWLVGRVDGDVIVTIPRPLVWDFVDQAISPIRRVAGGYPDVLAALVMLVRTVVATRPTAVDRLDHHLGAILEEAQRANLLPRDLEVVSQMIITARDECDAYRADTPPKSDESHPD